MVQNFFARLGRRSGYAGSFGDAIPATHTHEMLAVGEKRFAGVKGHFLARPVNAIGQAIGNIRLPRACEPNDAGGLCLEVRVMLSNDGVLLQSGLEFFRAGDAAGNNRVGINGTVGVRCCGRREAGIAPTPVQRQRRGIGWNIGLGIIRRRGVGVGPGQKNKDAQ